MYMLFLHEKINELMLKNLETTLGVPTLLQDQMFLNILLPLTPGLVRASNTLCCSIHV